MISSYLLVLVGVLDFFIFMVFFVLLFLFVGGFFVVLGLGINKGN